MVKPSTVVSKSDGVVTQKIGNESVIVPRSDISANLESVTVLNETGAFFLERANNTSLQEIASDVAQTFNVGYDDASRDLVAFAEKLCSAGYLSVVGTHDAEFSDAVAKSGTRTYVRPEMNMIRMCEQGHAFYGLLASTCCCGGQRCPQP